MALTVVIKGSDQSQAAFASVREGLSGVGEQAGATQGRLGSMLGTLGQVAGGAALGGIAAIGTAIAGAGFAGLSFNNSLEQTTARLNAFTKDGAKTAEILEMIKARAAQTPFAFEEMSAAAAALMPAAKASGKSLEELIAQAEILAASNPAEGLEGASFALKEALSGDFTSIIERFNLPRQRLNELKDQGVPALQAIQTAMRELGLDADLVGNMADTMSGRWGTFKDTLVNVAGTATAPLFDALSGGLAGVNDWLTANTPMLESFGATLAGAVSQGIQMVSGGLSAALPVIQGIGDALGGLVGAFTDAGPLSSEFGEALGYLAQQLGLPAAAVDVLQQAIFAVQGAFASLGEGGGLGQLTGILGQLGGIAQSAFAAVTSGVQQASPAFDTLLAAWSTATGAVQGVLGQLGGIVSSVLANVQGFIDTYGAQAVATFATTWATVQTTVANLVTALMGVISPILAQIQTFINAHGAEIQAFFATTWTQIGAIIQTAMALINATVVPILQGIGAFISAHGAEIQTILSASWTAISTIISTVLSTIQGIVTAALQILNGDWAGAWETIKNTCATIVQGIVTVVQSLVTSLATAFTVALDGAQAIVVGFVGRFSSAGANLVNGMIDGVRNAASGLASAAADAAREALDAAKRALGIQSPSREAAAQVGTPFVEGIAAGMEAAFGTLDGMAKIMSKRLTDQMAAAAAEATKAFKQMFQDSLQAGADMSRQLLTNAGTINTARGDGDKADRLREQQAQAQDDLNDEARDRDKAIAEVMTSSDFEENKAAKIAEINDKYNERLDDRRAKLAAITRELETQEAIDRTRGQIADRYSEQLEKARLEFEATKDADPAAAADRFQLRSKQIAEMLKLETDWAEAAARGDTDEVVRIQQKIDLTRQAQEAELRLAAAREQSGNPLNATKAKLEEIKKALEDELKLDQDRANRANNPNTRRGYLDEVARDQAALAQIQALIDQAGSGPSVTPAGGQGVRAGETAAARDVYNIRLDGTGLDEGRVESLFRQLLDELGRQGDIRIRTGAT